MGRLSVFCFPLRLPMRTEGIGHLKIFKDPTGNRTRNLSLVAQCLNQLRHSPPYTCKDCTSVFVLFYFILFPSARSVLLFAMSVTIAQSVS